MSNNKSLFVVKLGAPTSLSDGFEIYVVATSLQTAIHTVTQRLDEVQYSQPRDIKQVTRIASGLLGLCGV